MTLKTLRRSKTPTLQDVAEAAGVSKVAASVALNGSRSSAGVSEASRQRIVEAAARLRYHPNAVARSLRRSRTNIIGFYSGQTYVGARGGMFLSAILAGLQEGCEAYHKDLLVHGTFRGSSVEDIYGRLASGTIDGLILHAGLDDALTTRLVASPLPAVVIASPIAQLPSVVADDVNGMRLLLSHLAERGHKRILFRSSFEQHTSSRRRAAAFEQAAREQNIHVTNCLPGDGNSLSDCEKAVLFDAPPHERVTAAVGWNDSAARSLLRILGQANVRTPEDIAVAGFDGFVHSVEPRQNLTAVQVPWKEAARRAVGVLLAQIDGEEVPAETVIPVTLHVGTTT